jgi:dTDP-4-dehydrorhamnose 3,5-epimerase-like enzyme
MENKLPGIEQCRIIQLPKIRDDRGNLTFVENGRHIPFEVKRIFYLYDIPGGESRGAHAHFNCHQFLVAASGSFEVTFTDGRDQSSFFLNQPYYGLHIPPMIWASEVNFSSGAICLVLGSELFNEADYIRDYDDFLKFRNG